MRVLTPALDQAFAGGERPFVVAVPDGNGSAHPDTEWADSVDGRTLVETSLLTRILPAVEGPTPLPAGMRAIAGFSMGGYGAANLGLRHPNLFGQIVAISGYFHVDDPSRMFGGGASVRAVNTPDAMVAAAAGKRVQLIEATGESDPLIKGQAAEFAARLRDCGCAAAVDLRLDKGDHDVDFVGAEAPALVAFLDAGWAAPPPNPTPDPASSDSAMSGTPITVSGCDDDWCAAGDAGTDRPGPGGTPAGPGSDG
jgi:enterochelin esterase-like enzyme